MAKTGLTPTDELVRLAIIGDGTAFTRLWDTHIESVKSFLRMNLKVSDDFFVDDICSRSFEKAFRQIKTFDPAKGRFSTWLRTIAHNTALDTLKEEGRSSQRMVALEDNFLDERESPLESIIRNEDKDKLKDCVEALPELYRDVARCRLIESMQYKEISEELGMELNTVRTRIRRAKAIIDKTQKEKEDE